MINLINNKHITREQRIVALKRALFTTPFYAKLEFTVPDTAVLTNADVPQREKVPIDLDFFLTEVIGDFGENVFIFSDTFNLSIWTVYGQSIYRFDKSQPIPSGMLATEARHLAPIPAPQNYDDRQREFFPRHIPRGDRILGRLHLTGAGGFEEEITTVLKGFNILPNAFIDPDTQRACVESLDRPARYEYFKFLVDEEGHIIKTVENDSFPRVVLGFGVTNSTATKAATCNADVRIKDITRKISFMDKTIPIDFIAPRLTCLADEHLYYLPTEYYLRPFARLQFEMDVVHAAGQAFNGFEFNVLTRTI